MDGLGRLFNYVAEASGVHIPLDGARGVTFLCYEADGSQIVTLKESIDGASEQNLVVIDTIWHAPGIGGVWTKVTQTALATYDNADHASDCIAFYVDGAQLSDGFNCLELTTDEASGLGVRAIIHDLYAQRAPELLPSSVV